MKLTPEDYEFFEEERDKLLNERMKQEPSEESAIDKELVSNLVEIASRRSSSSGGYCLLSARRQLG